MSSLKKSGINGQVMKLFGNGIMVTEDFVVFLIDLTEMQRNVFWMGGIPYIVLARSLALSNHDVGMVLQGMGVTCCGTSVVADQKVGREPPSIPSTAH